MINSSNLARVFLFFNPKSNKSQNQIKVKSKPSSMSRSHSHTVGRPPAVFISDLTMMCSSSMVAMATCRPEYSGTFQNIQATTAYACSPGKYLVKRQKQSQQWQNVRMGMVKQLVRNAYPATFVCCHCRRTDEDAQPISAIYRCRDCGPQAYFCDCHLLQQHSIVKLHKPEKWDPEVQ